MGRSLLSNRKFCCYSCSLLLLICVLTYNLYNKRPKLYEQLSQDYFNPLKVFGRQSSLISKNSIEDISKKQSRILQEFCKRHPELSATAPLFNFFLYDDAREFIYCYIPKVGCTNFVYMFHVLNGVLPANQSFLDLNVHRQRNNPRLIHLSPEEREWRLKKYFKVVMLRDPAERMLSAYMDKLEFTLPRRSNDTTYNAEKYAMMKSDLIDRINKYLEGKSTSSTISFNKNYLEFKKYLEYLTLVDKDVDRHFKRMIDICSPCNVNFTFFGNFATLTEDTYMVLDKVNIPRWMYSVEKKHAHVPVTIQEWMDVYYGDMTVDKRKYLKKRLHTLSNHSFEALSDEGVSRELLKTAFAHYSVDFDFYQSLFPYERNTREYYLQKKL